jgi:hypothetical protein
MAANKVLSQDEMGNPIWIDNNQADPWALPDNTSDVPGRTAAAGNQSIFGRLFEPTTDANSRDASQTPETPPVTKDAGATGSGILHRMWNAMAHPLQTVEDAGSATGNAAGAAVGNAAEKILSGITKGLIPIVLIIVGGIILLAFVAGSTGLLRARVSA